MKLSELLEIVSKAYPEEVTRESYMVMEGDDPNNDVALTESDAGDMLAVFLVEGIVCEFNGDHTDYHQLLDIDNFISSAIADLKIVLEAIRDKRREFAN